MEGPRRINAEIAGPRGNLGQASPLDLDINSGRTPPRLPCGQLIKQEAHHAGVAGIVQHGPTALRGRTAGEQHWRPRGSSLDQGQGLHHAIGNSTQGTRLRAGRLPQRSPHFFQQIDAQLQDISTRPSSPPRLPPNVIRRRPGQGDGHSGRSPGNAATPPDERRDRAVGPTFGAAHTGATVTSLRTVRPAHRPLPRARDRSRMSWRLVTTTPNGRPATVVSATTRAITSLHTSAPAAMTSRRPGRR